MSARTLLTESYWPADTGEPIVEVTVGELLRQAAAEVPERTALVAGVFAADQRRRWTYGELLAESERTARARRQPAEPTAQRRCRLSSADRSPSAPAAACRTHRPTR